MCSFHNNRYAKRLHNSFGVKSLDIWVSGDIRVINLELGLGLELDNIGIFGISRKANIEHPYVQ